MRFNLDDINIGGDRSVNALAVTLRIPGTWRQPEEFYAALPPGFRCNERGLVLADGTEFELNVLPADDDFPRVFAGSCAKLPTENERERIENFKVNMCVTGPGGSLATAKKLMAAGAALVRAGGAGVFVDNSGIAHGATDWLTLTESADDGGVYWAFVTAVRGDGEVYSVGMHILGFRDAIIPATGDEEYDARTLNSFLGFATFSGAELHDGHVVNDPDLPTFVIRTQADDRFPADAPMFNALGRWKLERVHSAWN